LFTRVGSDLAPTYDLHGCISVTVSESVKALLRDVAVNYVSAIPTNIRVEREMVSEVPEHHLAQADYLARQVTGQVSPTKVAESFGAPESEAEGVIESIAVMNIAYLREAADIAGISQRPLVGRASTRQRADRLCTILNSVTEPGHRGDRLVTDYWALGRGARHARLVHVARAVPVSRRTRKPSRRQASGSLLAAGVARAACVSMNQVQRDSHKPQHRYYGYQENWTLMAVGALEDACQHFPCLAYIPLDCHTVRPPSVAVPPLA
jgi:hypothetical protein